MKTASAGPCPSCGAATVTVPDRDTREDVVLDEQRVDQGTVQLLRVGPVITCLQLGRPAAMQPAHQRHSCPASAPTTEPEERDDPGIEQARWRQA